MRSSHHRDSDKKADESYARHQRADPQKGDELAAAMTKREIGMNARNPKKGREVVNVINALTTKRHSPAAGCAELRRQSLPPT